MEMLLLQEIATDAQLSGEQGYCLATFQVALAPITRMRPLRAEYMLMTCCLATLQVALRWVLGLKWDQLQFGPNHPLAPAAPLTPMQRSWVISYEAL